jgi:hypothetical protein
VYDNLVRTDKHVSQQHQRIVLSLTDLTSKLPDRSLQHTSMCFKIGIVRMRGGFCGGIGTLAVGNRLYGYYSLVAEGGNPTFKPEGKDYVNYL